VGFLVAIQQGNTGMSSIPSTGEDADSKAESRAENDEEAEEEKKEADHLDHASSAGTIDEPCRQDAIVEITNLNHKVEIEHISRTCTRSDCSTSTATTVSFGSVQVREYERVIDSTDKFMGLALGWSYNDMGPSPMKERNHASKYAAGGGGDEKKMKRTNGSDRYGMMLRYGYVPKELKQATKEAASFYEQRQRDAARALVVAEQRTKQDHPTKPKRRPLLRSMFG
jgi:hypothetical protein